jgi:hypothetical protein
MNVCIIGPNLIDQSKGSFHVHRDGCADIRRNPIYRGEDTDWIVDVDSVQEAVEAVYMDIIEEHEEGDGWDTWEAYESDLHFCPCCKGLKRTSS